MFFGCNMFIYVFVHDFTSFFKVFTDIAEYANETFYYLTLEKRHVSKL